MDSKAALVWTRNVVGNKLAEELLRFPFSKILDESSLTPLCSLMSKYGSDKGNGWHNYTLLYHYLLDEARGNVLDVFELGLGTNNTDVLSSMGSSGTPGASLRGWRDYFPNASIFGADIDRRVLFSEERISTHYCDQSNSMDVQALWKAIGNRTFDLIIDDGWHAFAANRTFLEGSLHKLTPNGLYVIEDVVVDDRNISNFMVLLQSIDLDSAIVKLPSKDNVLDNCLALIRKSS